MTSRRRTGQRLILGLQPVREAIRVQGELLETVLLEAGNRRLDGLESLAQSRGAPVERVSRDRLESLSKNAAHQGAAALAAPLALVSLDSLLGKYDLLLALDGIQDPQNFGAVIRSAVGLMGAPVIWPEHASAPLSPATFRASAGTIEHAVLCRVRSLRQVVQDAVDANYAAIGLDANADRSLRELDLTGPTLLLLGAEGEGLSRGVRRSCTSLARLELARPVDSLNASVAAALALYEAQSQRALVSRSNSAPATTSI